MSKDFWMQRGGLLEGSKFPYESSPKMESKRSHQWFMENTEADLFPHKKQNVEVQSDPVFPGIPNARASLWEHSSGFHTVTSQSAERLFDDDSTRTINFDDRLITSADARNMNVGRNNNSDPFGSESSFGLSISHKLEDPKSSINYCGYRKVKVSQVKDSDTIQPMSMGHKLHNGDGYHMSFAQGYSKLDVNVIPTSLAYEKAEGHNILTGGTFHQGNNSFISMGQPFSKQDSISIHQDYRPNESIISMSHSVSTEVNSDVSVFQNYCKGEENGISKNPTSENNLIYMGHSYSKENDSRTQLSHDEHGSSSEPGANPYENENSILMGSLYSKRENNVISFGVYDDEPNTAGRVICNYDLLMGRCERTAAASHDEPTKHHVDLAVSSHQAASASGTTATKEDLKTNKDLPNSFPSNVRSLLSTGMMDGVPVKYVAWSREKELHAVIKGTGYLCGCQSCNHSKVINAYEFERHAGCKTKHPNNHIYFENGKTIYGAVQELRSTPQNMLFDVIQTITGSPINQKSFRLWKESFLAATRELQRIYGKDEAKRLH